MTFPDASDAPATPPRVRLTTFGTVGLEGPDGRMSGVAVQRRRLALLALLAANPDALSRDRIIGLLWPEREEDRARHALAQLVHAVRRSMGDDSIEGSNSVLRLNAARVASDIADFKAAVHRSDHERIARLYRAPFLDGFYLDGCPEFERWVEQTRAELAGRAEGALRALAADASRRGDHHLGVEWGRRLATLRPLDSVVAVTLMRAMVAAGDRAGAIQYARTYESMVRAELDVPPDDAILELIAELRARNAAAPADMTLERGESHIATDDPQPSTSNVPSVQEPVRPIARARRNGIAIGAGVAGAALVATALAVMLGLEGNAPSGTNAASWIVIADAENRTGDAVFDRAVPVALAAALAQSPRVRVVDPDRVGRVLARMRRPPTDSVITEPLAREIAQREGAPLVVVPTIDTAGGAYELSARVIDGMSGGVLAFSTARAAHRADVMAALDRLARELRRELGESRRSIGRNAVALPQVTTSSLDALKKFADGSRAWRAQRLDEARQLWTQAVSLDTSFATAHLNLGMFEYWNNRPTEGNRHLTAALAHAGSLPEREQTLIRAHVLEWRGDRAAAVSLLAPLLVQRPDDVEALDAIAYDDFRLHRYQEAVDAYRRVLAIDSMDASAWLNRAESESDLGRHADAMHSFGRAFAIEPALLTANDNLNLEYATALVRAGRRDSAQAVIELLAAQPDPLRRARAQRSMAFLAEFDGRYADAARRLTEAVALSRTTGSTISEVRNRVLLATALTELGRRRDASNQLDSAFAMADSVAGEPTMVFWLGKALARAGKLRYASRLVSVLESQPATGSTYRAMLESLRAEVLLGERKPAEAVERAQVATQVDSSAAVVETLAVALEASGALDRAAERYAWLAVHAPKFGFEGQHESQFAAFWLAHVREHAGNGQAARDAYEDFLIRWPPASSADLPAVAEARRRLERLAPAEPRR